MYNSISNVTQIAFEVLFCELQLYTIYNSQLVGKETIFFETKKWPIADVRLLALFIRFEFKSLNKHIWTFLLVFIFLF